MSSTLSPNSISLPATVLQERYDLADKLEKLLANDKAWYDFESPQAYRDARRNGLNGFKKPVVNPAARTIKITGRDSNEIELRVISPSAGNSRGVWLHFHAGGFVIGSNSSYDTYLTRLSEDLGMTLVSVEYRLAPENAHPAGANDCVDAALFSLSTKGQQELGSALRVLGGESAGATLAVMTALTLRDDHDVDVRSRIAAICAGYGVFDLTYTPSVYSHERAIVLSKKDTFKFFETTFGHIPFAERKSPKISPLYADLTGLPPAQFLVGTIEPLIDDSIFMAAKWQQAGNETELSVIEGACHAFTLIPMGSATEDGLQRLTAFVAKHL